VNLLRRFAEMKVFRIELTSPGTTFVEADSYIQDEDSLRFYRGGVLLTEYLPRTVKKVEETVMTAQEGLFSVLSLISVSSP
jgi:hypothetical protein